MHSYGKLPPSNVDKYSTTPPISHIYVLHCVTPQNMCNRLLLQDNTTPNRLLLSHSPILSPSPLQRSPQSTLIKQTIIPCLISACLIGIVQNQLCSVFFSPAETVAAVLLPYPDRNILVSKNAFLMFHSLRHREMF